MAVADHGWAVRFSVLLLAVTLERGMNFRVAARSLGDEEKPIYRNYTVGQTVKMIYKPGIRERNPSNLKSGYWMWNKSIIVPNDYIVIGISKDKRKFWLRIKNVKTSNSGHYSFTVNGTVLKQWQLHVTEEFSDSDLQGDQGQLSPCGRPLRSKVTSCVPFSETSHPKCQSFPGPPLNVKVSSYLYKRKPVVQVTWEPPNTGRSDLWGYHVYIVGKDWHPGHYDCFQINNKTGNRHWIFLDHIKYGATYQVIVQSLPALHGSDTNKVSRDIKVLENCQFSEYRNSHECCSLINITAEYIDKKIYVAWTVSSQKQCREIDIFRIRWNNIQKPAPCNGEKVIQGKFNYTIHLEKEECFRFNYSIKLSGKTNKTEWSKMSKVTVLIPPTIPPSHVWPSQVMNMPPDNTPKILIAVFCSLLGIAICTLLVVYRVYFQQVRIKLPDPSPVPRPPSDQPLLNCDSGKKRVFILHSRCCDKCNHVVHCLGTVLSSTELIEPSIDMWNTLDISPNVPRWYEDQVKKSDCVIVLGSSKMSRRCQNSLEEGDDPLQIKCQLNFVRGNIAQNPDTHRFIPAFFTCNGSKKDIPDFLSDRWSHKLPKEVDRVIFRVLNVEKIQPHRFQPIVVMGGNGHPFDERKKELERAVQEAEIYHRNNLQV